MLRVLSPARRSWTLLRRKPLTWPQQRLLAFYGFVSLWIAGFVFLTIAPTVVGFVTSFTNYDGFNLTSLKFVGLMNYGKAFTEQDVSYAFSRTLLWCMLNVPTWLTLSFGLALVLNQKIRGRGVFRTLYYLPSVIPAIVVVRAWGGILNQYYGALNGLISLFRPDTAIAWLGPELILYSAAVMSIWQGVGSGMVVFLAGLQGIPEELKEAALIDGANRLQVFRHVTMPLMTPVIFYQLVMSLIHVLQVGEVSLMMGGFDHGRATPPRSLYFYSVHIYKQVFDFQRYGYGSALAWLMFVVVAGATVLLFKTSRRWVFYQSDVSERRDG